MVFDIASRTAVFSHVPMRNIGFLGRKGTYACPQCLPSDTVPIRSWTWMHRPPVIGHRHLPYHTIPYCTEQVSLANNIGWLVAADVSKLEDLRAILPEYMMENNAEIKATSRFSKGIGPWDGVRLTCNGRPLARAPIIITMAMASLGDRAFESATTGLGS